MKRRNYLQSLSSLAGLAGVSVVSAQQQYPQWDSSATYTGGDRVVYDGYVWEAQWWSQGDEPGSSEWGPWEQVRAVDGNGGDSGGSSGGSADIPAWDATTAYTGGDQVTFDGFVWEAKWWTRGDEPGSSEWGPWKQVRAVDSGGSDGGDSGGGNDPALTASFTTSTQFPDVGETVEFDAGDSAGGVESYEWSFGDGTTATGQTVTHAFEQGQFEVSLTVTDGSGGSPTESVQITAGRPRSDEQRVVAYYRQWSQFDRNYLPADINFEKVTHLQYAFARPGTDGSVSLVGDSYGQNVFSAEKDWQQPDRGRSFAGYAAERDDVKFVLSIGGWSDSENFSDAALTQSSREQFASDCASLVENNDLDGVDIDWEYPGGGGKDGNTVRDGDQERFTLLVEEVRNQLDAAAEANPDRDEPYEVTAAASADPDTVRGLEHGRLSDLLDFVSVMTFDYRGIFSDTTGHHAPLRENPADPSATSGEWNADAALSFYADQGWDPEQLNMAVPFYGRSWANVQPPEGDFGNGVDDGLFQQFQGSGADASGDGSYPGPAGSGTSLGGVWEYFDLGGDGRATGEGRIASNPIDLDSGDWETYFDEQAVCSYSYSPSQSLMISHPTTRSIEEKMRWLAGSDYGGTMLWAAGADTKEGDLITTLYDTLNA